LLLALHIDCFIISEGGSGGVSSVARIQADWIEKEALKKRISNDKLSDNRNDGGRMTNYRHQQTELSTIDTTTIAGGAVLIHLLYAGTETKVQIRTLADARYRRIDWPWAYSEKHKPLFSLGWRPENGYIGALWRGYNDKIWGLTTLNTQILPADGWHRNKNSPATFGKNWRYLSTSTANSS